MAIGVSGRPDKVQIVFDRKITSRTPGRFQTKVITKGVEPVIQAHYKHSKVKQYFKEGRALRTETTVNDPYDFGVKRTLSATTWQQLRTIGDDIKSLGIVETAEGARTRVVLGRYGAFLLQDHR